MKFLVLAAAATIASVQAADCSLAALAPIAGGANAQKCTAASGLSFLPPSLPTAAQVPKLCASNDCRAFLADLKKAQPTECTISISNPPLELYKQLIDPLEKTCGPPGGSPPAPASAPAPATPNATPAPANQGQGQTKPTPAPADNSC